MSKFLQKRKVPFLKISIENQIINAVEIFTSCKYQSCFQTSKSTTVSVVPYFYNR